MSDVTHVRSQLEQSRKELLDLTLRNALLNYRPSRVRGVDVVDELSAEVFRTVVTDGKAMRFRRAADAPVEERPDPAALLFSGVAPVEDNDVAGNGEPDGPAARHVDRWLQTAYEKDRLQTRLINTARDARTMLEEKGVNVLYLALGMLRWVPDDGTDRVRLAPLVLVPVRLERKNVASHYRVMRTGEDVGTNLSLWEKLRADFGIELPAPPEEAEDFDPTPYFAGVEAAVANLTGWEVERDRVTLGFFSFGRFLMFHDLGGDAWPDGRKPWDHDILYDLFEGGLRERPAPETPADSHRLEVVDADSSQQDALARAAAHAVVVIQGPPGTGKSQTITNLIAAAVARGERVLFVAEKMAALEVVKRRLDRVGLGDACLELHSHKSSKRRVIEEIGRTLETGRPVSRDGRSEQAALDEARGRLDAYCGAVNEPVGETGVTPHEAMGELLEMGERIDALPRFESPDLARWTADGYGARERLVGELESARGALGPPREHLFWGACLTELLPKRREAIAALVVTADAARAELVEAAEETVTVLGTRGCPEASVLRRNIRALDHLRGAPPLDGIRVTSKSWYSRAADVDHLLDVGSKASGLRVRFDPDLLPEAWDDDLVESRRDLNYYGRKWWRLLSGRYRTARRHIAGFCRGAPPRSVDGALKLCDVVLEVRSLENELLELAGLGEKLFGEEFQGPGSDWTRLREVAIWCKSAHRVTHDGDASARLLSVAWEGFSAETVERALERARAALSTSHAAFETLEKALDWSGVRGESLAALAFDDAADRLDAWKVRLPALHELVTFNRLAADCDDQGLHEVAAAAITWTGADKGLRDAFRASRLRAVADRAFEERDDLARFDRAVHEELVARFRDLDARQFTRNRARIALDHWRRLPGHAAGGQLGLLRHEIRKKSRHLPLRVLLRRAGRAVQAVKPVFMMSPMSIATYLAPEGPRFDVVVFDEASQVRPVDALGAVLRGDRLVVVGDTRQLPPTTFFDRLTRGEDDDPDEPDLPVTRDVESVLTLCLARGARPGMLRWHYRSRHPSLIAVSNRVFYDDRLIVFPSPQADTDPSPEGLGLVLRHLPDAVYEQGEATNAGEARAVAEAVLEHARSAPALSLGVAAFSVRQKARLEAEIELLRVREPGCEAFFRAHPHEPFFVKNLENVQGDERDVIFISVGYGRQADGRVSMNFGPLNQGGGERRLNVLVTRARRRCEVFTNLTSDDIDLKRTEAEGVRALKQYLHYAESGSMDAAGRGDDGVEPPLEAAVHHALRGAGVDVDARVGTGGFRLDLAARDARAPGRYTAGVQCDGATYRSAKSTRDRDRLRGQVLASLGWCLHQVWSVAWFRDPEGELERVREAVASGAAPPSATGREMEPLERDAEAPPPGMVAVPPYVAAEVSMKLGEKELHEITPGIMAGWIQRVVAAEGPIHAQEAARRVRETAGSGRDGARISEAIEAGLRRAVEKGQVLDRGGFLWPPDMETPPLRDRADLPPARRTIDLIAPEELDVALVRAVEESFGIGDEEAVRAALRHVGMRRATDDAEEAVRARIAGLLAAGRLHRERGELVA